MSGGAPPPGLYVGRVMHVRVRPVRRRFVYRVFSLFVDVDDPAGFAKGCALLSHNRFNVLSFQERDHGARDASPLRPWVEATLRRAGIAEEPDAIRLLCFPRLWGYVFNPLSVFYCYAGGRAFAAIYEVNNTFGDTHAYVARLAGGGDAERHTADKLLYVSPLIGMDARYEFALRPPGERLSLAIRETGPEGLILTAVQTGAFRALSTWTALKAVLAHPLMTLKIVAAIHGEALATWLRGAPLVERPVGPTVPASRAEPMPVAGKSEAVRRAYRLAAE